MANADSGDLDVDGAMARWRARLGQHRDEVDRDPHVNPIRLLAYEILQEIQAGEVASDDLDAIVQQMTMIAFADRARRLRAYVGEVDRSANLARIGEIVRGLARSDAAGPEEGGGDGQERDLLPFETFAAAVGRFYFGVVFTAHPTFSLAQDLQRDLVTLALDRDEEGHPLDEASRASVQRHAASEHHRPERRLDLDEEYRQSLIAIGNIRAALAEVYRAVFDTARTLYPDEHRTLVPGLLSIATWVGYDTDGRADIGWSVTFAKRVRTQIDQLRYYRRRIARIRGEGEPPPVLAASLELIDARLALAVKSLLDEVEAIEAFDARAPESHVRLAAMARRAAGEEQRLDDARHLTALVERALDLASSETHRRELWVLRAEIANAGLVAARTHVRINAVQLYNAIRKTIGMEHPADDPTHRASYLDAVVRLIDEVEPVSIHFGSVMEEKATAKRVFMLIRLMLRHLDGSEPVRFLIAECETPLTLLTALYFARLFDVADRVDISPLFETATAMERGVEILKGALEVESWRVYLRRRGRICIQTGFSDAGRYMGQLAASYTIERLRLDLCAMLAQSGLEDLEVVIFDTHGESIGRGAHPSSLADRLKYYGTPQSVACFRRAGIHLLQETSFQGGDGYVYFLREESALAVVTRVLEHAVADADEAARRTDFVDPFYATGHRTEEFFAAVRQFNARVIDDPCYAAFLGTWGTNMLYPTGSRPLKRQSDRGGVAGVDLEHPSQLRAIPHNSILQQQGILANTIGGLGQAIAKDPDWFHALYRDSRRFRRLMTMAEHAFKFTDPDVVKAYVDLLDAGLWLRRAQLEKLEQREEDLSRVAELLEQMDLYGRLARIFRVFLADYTGLARALRDHRRMTRDAGDQPIAIDAEVRDNIHLLHALRLALMQKLMLQVIHVPDFSDRHRTTHDELIARMVRLDIGPALELLREVFPLTERGEELDFGETATYRSGENQSYAQEHALIFRPIAAHYDLVRRISSGIIHHIGALG
ncbi:MAG: phosphoenolpyruvate carboxylase [Geminicoccaceae bacterium]|nr:phosphoenolpyruvate carboxylase [Geminicoccaceae bacterium]